MQKNREFWILRKQLNRYKKGTVIDCEPGRSFDGHRMKRAAEIPTSSLHAEIENVSDDLSILRKPIKTSVNGLNEARKAYEDGTDEVCLTKTFYWNDPLQFIVRNWLSGS